MRIGLFGGSFNPVHNGHIKIAEYAYKTMNLDKIYFIPTAISPFKKKNTVAPDNDRINMLNIALENFNGNSEVSLFEIKRGGVSYTFETIRYFKNKFPNDELFFIIGSDLVPKFHKWEFVDEMTQKCQFVVYKRNKNINKINAKKYGLKIMNNPIFSESSTKVRQGELNLTDPKVNKYIGNNFLYAKEIIHSLLTAKRAKHCVSAAEFAVTLAKSINYDAKKAYYAGLFHDICKELDEKDSRAFIGQFIDDSFDPIKLPSYKLHQVAGALWFKYIYMNDDEEIFNAIKVHTSLALELSTLDKILYIADKICDGRAFAGVQKLRKLALENFDECFKEVVNRNIEYNLAKNISFSKEQNEINNKWNK
ncbi:nicotinate-nucleotide adenylyltransferase [Mycoplasma bovis]|uniref:nicotinate-nucleotide adenylyltransferase n=1 Tax=Mycoplasmopsis bovis TaxID=28903 RepID=UPI001BDEF407|nr:nicotinate-nucleotide adenylyltransferase [Mycoplasmopsis bovis]MBT1345066.1 nicotinate-nucleotide adenylyltransferase [Mycoplasmopsis bovis]MBT1369732.1 nicotinate-nucleotide adenylyltransferase [Mycoplasmopsis bovis]MBT1371043.1 nicotinate-nucleotide adenylyltransferase [Mycoplasmopsis bovis]MBT1376284.1 nicotinate-nucleotide adenylyltransferase [Mycoplasmopsis bovis]MBT1381977.1 nicotinate-nucleotide adenylyltransferase [Mycoplasmopsis bovis]